MKITKKQDGSALVVALEGRLDTTTAPELEAELKGSLDGITDLTLDMAKLDYISSAGLRVLLAAALVGVPAVLILPLSLVQPT